MKWRRQKLLPARPPFVGDDTARLVFIMCAAYAAIVIAFVAAVIGGLIYVICEINLVFP